MDSQVSGSLPRVRRTPVADMLVSYGTKIIGAALGLGNVLIVARVLGPDGRGSVSFVFATTLLVAQLASLGAHWAIPNLGVGDRRLLRVLTGNAVVLSLVLGGSAIAVMGLTVHLVPAIGGHVDSGTRWIGLVSVPVLILTYCLLMVAQSDYRFGFMNISMLLVPLTTLCTNSILAAAGALSVRSVIVVWVIAQILGLAVLAWCVHRHVAGFGRPDARVARRMVGFGIKAHVGQMGMAGTYRLDQWLLGAISGARALGLYSVAVAWAEVLFFLPEAVAMVQRPDFVRASRKEAFRSAATGFRATALITLVSAAFVVVAAPFLCTTIFGPAYSGSIRDLRILALGGFGVVAIKQLGVVLTAQGKPLLETGAILVALGATALADLLLIPAHADIGASIASTLSYTAGGVAMVLVFVRTLGGRPADLLPGGTELSWVFVKARALARKQPATG
jgi:O-antigen/teichoic acid export membrane protein